MLRDRNEDPLGPAEDVDVFLAGQADGGGVDDGHHLLEVIGEHPVEEGLVAVLEGGEEDVFFQVEVLRW